MSADKKKVVNSWQGGAKRQKAPGKEMRRGEKGKDRWTERKTDKGTEKSVMETEAWGTR